MHISIRVLKCYIATGFEEMKLFVVVEFFDIVTRQCVGHLKVFFGFQFVRNKSLATREAHVFFVPCFKLELYTERSWNGAVGIMSRLLAG